MSEFLDKTTVLVGGHVPHSISNHFSLVVLAEGESRSNVIKTLVTNYLKGKSIDNLIEEIAQRILEEWRKKEKALRLDRYLELKVSASLKSKGITQEHIKAILDKAEELNETHKKSETVKQSDT